jgi:hypothetical protein
MKKEDSGLGGRMSDFAFTVVSEPKAKADEKPPKKPAPKNK